MKTATRKPRLPAKTCDFRVIEASADTFIAELPVRTVSELNAREHHFAKARRVKKRRGDVAALLRFYRVGMPQFPVTVTMTRIAPGLLDEGDNLQSSMKNFRDEIAELFNVDDGDPRWTWLVKQERSKAYGVRVRIERRRNNS